MPSFQEPTVSIDSSSKRDGSNSSEIHPVPGMPSYMNMDLLTFTIAYLAKLFKLSNLPSNISCSIS